MHLCEYLLLFVAWLVSLLNGISFFFVAKKYGDRVCEDNIDSFPCPEKMFAYSSRIGLDAMVGTVGSNNNQTGMICGGRLKKNIGCQKPEPRYPIFKFYKFFNAGMANDFSQRSSSSLVSLINDLTS